MRHGRGVRLDGTIRQPALLRCGTVAGPLFVTTFLVEGATRADYDPLRHPVSSLALGPGGWVQVANFSVTGVLYTASAAGLGRAVAATPTSPAGLRPSRR